ncbi:hypothetical protein PIB30_022838 [Stylosanthes scabra]|uniref:Uncharacterized protein n=1 Tax=Stylosanthes scabra TaxID=79078 RepID=A0ABU6W963_9FABA|nr:hypothetical protein [Stylosanthes scabra]
MGSENRITATNLFLTKAHGVDHPSRFTHLCPPLHLQASNHLHYMHPWPILHQPSSPTDLRHIILEIATSSKLWEHRKNYINFVK